MRYDLLCLRAKRRESSSTTFVLIASSLQGLWRKSSSRNNAGQKQKNPSIFKLNTEGSWMFVNLASATEIQTNPVADSQPINDLVVIA